MKNLSKKYRNKTIHLTLFRRWRAMALAGNFCTLRAKFLRAYWSVTITCEEIARDRAGRFCMTPS